VKDEKRGKRKKSANFVTEERRERGGGTGSHSLQEKGGCSSPVSFEMGGREEEKENQGVFF